MPNPLSSLERRILDVIVDYLRRNTYQPSIREIARRFGIKSTKTVSEYLQSLADKGWIERDPARSRGVRVIGLAINAGTVTVPQYDRLTNKSATPAGMLELDVGVHERRDGDVAEHISRQGHGQREQWRPIKGRPTNGSHQWRPIKGRLTNASHHGNL